MKWLRKSWVLSLSSRSINAAEPIHIPEMRKTVVNKNIIDLLQSLFSVRVRGVFAPANVNANAPLFRVIRPVFLAWFWEKNPQQSRSVGKRENAKQLTKENNWTPIFKPLIRIIYLILHLNNWCLTDKEKMVKKWTRSKPFSSFEDL